MFSSDIECENLQDVRIYDPGTATIQAEPPYRPSEIRSLINSWTLKSRERSYKATDNLCETYGLYYGQTPHCPSGRSRREVRNTTHDGGRVLDRT